MATTMFTFEINGMIKFWSLKINQLHSENEITIKDGPGNQEIIVSHKYATPHSTN